MRRKEEGRNASFSREVRRLNESMEKKGPLEVSIDKRENSLEKRSYTLELFESYSGESTGKSVKKRRNREERNTALAKKDKEKPKEDFSKRIDEGSLKKVQHLLQKMSNQGLRESEESEIMKIMNIQDERSYTKVLFFA